MKYSEMGAVVTVPGAESWHDVGEDRKGLLGRDGRVEV